MKVKVKAKLSHNKFGVYGGQRKYNGDVFFVEPENVSKTWMVEVEDKTETAKKETATKKGDGAK